MMIMIMNTETQSTLPGASPYGGYNPPTFPVVRSVMDTKISIGYVWKD